MPPLFTSGFSRVWKACSKTRSLLGEKLKDILGRSLDDNTLEELEQILFEADLGSTLVLAIIEQVRTHAKKQGDKNNLIQIMKDRAEQILKYPPHVQVKEVTTPPKVILVVGVNGSGKTTSAAKLAKMYKDEGKRVLLAAGDTFRAAAIEQLQILSNQIDVDYVKGSPGGDPSATIFDALTSAKARGYDIVIADTAGRLQSKTDLMKELSKIKQVTHKLVPNSPHEIYLVIDATTGQNAIDQAKTFNTFAPLTGLIFTKLDGSARGGTILSIYNLMKIPVRYIGIGEKNEDLVPFDPKAYVNALFS